MLKNTLLVGAGGFLGASARYLVGLLVSRLLPATFPFATMLVNVSGCLAIGFLAVLVDERFSHGPNIRLFWMIGILGARIWVQNKVDFSNPVNLTTAAVALIVGVANYTWTPGNLTFAGIALGTAAAIGTYHLMRGLARWRGTLPSSRCRCVPGVGWRHSPPLPLTHHSGWRGPAAERHLAEHQQRLHHRGVRHLETGSS